MLYTLFALFISLLGGIGLIIHSGIVKGKMYKGMFVYYTNISNLVIFIYELLIALSGIFGIKNIYEYLTGADISFVMTLSILITHIIYHFVLVPSHKKCGRRFADGLGGFDNLIIHYIVPLFTLLQWIICADKNVCVYSTVVWLLIPLTYFIVTLLRAKLIGKIGKHSYRYPYIFLNPDIIGVAGTAKNFALTVLGFFSLGSVLYCTTLLIRIIAWCMRIIILSFQEG